MESLVLAVAKYGHSILFFVVLAESLGMPVPAALALLVAGGASARGALHPGVMIATGIGAMLIGDTILYFTGRYTGWGLLGFLCRLSLNPEACILRSADTFYRKGRVILVFAKFLPGLNTMAPPLAGSMNLPFTQFFPLDTTGAALYILTYFGIGYLFSDFLGAIMHGYSTFGNVVGWLVAGFFVVWFANRVRYGLRTRRESPVPMISPEEAASRDTIAIFDVRSHGYYETGTMRIKGSRRIEPNALVDQIEMLRTDREIVLYCTCVREITAIRVARMLAERGIPSAVIAGGLTAWKKASLPLEPVPDDEMVLLPKFA
jgi:membrane protein DedA with SNARE-associated domain/rhodanese-related sulfurtransferase